MSFLKSLDEVSRSRKYWKQAKETGLCVELFPLPRLSTLCRMNPTLSQVPSRLWQDLVDDSEKTVMRILAP